MNEWLNEYGCRREARKFIYVAYDNSIGLNKLPVCY